MISLSTDRRVIISTRTARPPIPPRKELWPTPAYKRQGRQGGQEEVIRFNLLLRSNIGMSPGVRYRLSMYGSSTTPPSLF